MLLEYPGINKVMLDIKISKNTGIQILNLHVNNNQPTLMALTHLHTD